MANIFAVFAAIAITISPAACATPWPYIGFAITHGTMGWIYASDEKPDYALVFQMVFFFVLDIYGSLVRIGIVPGI